MQEKNNLIDFPNCDFKCVSISNISIAKESQDFCYNCTINLITSQFGIIVFGRFLIIYRDTFQKIPLKLKLFASQIIGLFIYFPLAKLALWFESLGFNVSNFPLSDYRDKSSYFMRADALDRIWY